MLYFALDEEERLNEEMHLMNNIPPDLDFIAFYVMKKRKYKLNTLDDQLYLQREIAHYKNIAFTQEEALD